MKRTALLLSITFCIGVILFAGSWSPVYAKTYKLTYSNFFPPTHIQSQLAEAWCNELKSKPTARW